MRRKTAMASGDGRSTLSKLFTQKKNQRLGKLVPDDGGTGVVSHGKRPYPSLSTNEKEKQQKKKDSDAFHSTIADFHASASLESSVSQPPALVSASGVDLHDEHNDLEETLRQFDMDMRYGPCIGMNRILRWERAHNMGMHPPIQIKEILEGASGAPACLWEGRI